MNCRRVNWIIPGLLCLAGLPGVPAQTPTYTADVQPIMIRNGATPCHYPGGVGPFSLLTYGDVAKRGKFIPEVTQAHYTGKLPSWQTRTIR